MIEAIVEEGLEATLGAGRSQRVGGARAGYRHGARERQLTTSLSKTTIMLPRARLKDAEDLFTFLQFPQSQWKALRTTNALERINGEFRRRTKNSGLAAR